MRTFTAVMAIALTVMLVGLNFASVNTVNSDDKTLYEKRCGTCHEIDGKGKQSVADIKEVDIARMDLTAERNREKSDTDLVKIVREGKEKMMAILPRNLSDDDLKAIVRHIRTLQKK